MLIDSKMIISGNCVEIYDYARPIYVSEKADFHSRSSAVNMRRLVLSNVYRWRDKNNKVYQPIFLTLTFKERTTSIVDARRLLRLFCLSFNKFRRGVDGELNKYTCVMEFQKRGTPHFHLLYYNMPYVEGLPDVIRGLWTHGFVFDKVIERGSAPQLAVYMAKYLAKDFDKVAKAYVDYKYDLTLFGMNMISSEVVLPARGRDRYYSSKGLARPYVIMDKFSIEKFDNEILRKGGVLEYETGYSSRSVYYVNYERWNVDDKVFSEGLGRLVKLFGFLKPAYQSL